MKSRRLFLFVNTLILILSLLTALRVLPGPDMVGMLLAFYALFLLPGFMITRLVSYKEVGLLEYLCRIFIGGLLFLTIILTLGFVPWISYLGIVIAGFITNIAMLFLIGSQRGGTERERGYGAFSKRGSGESRSYRTRVVVILLLFVICFVFFYGSGETGWDSDAPDHMSYVRRSLDSGVLFPNDSFYRNGDGVGFDPRKGIWHPVMALWAYQGELPPELLWRMLPSFIAFFALAFFLLFVVTVTGRPLLAPAALLLLLLFYRGEGVAWLVKVGFSRNVAHVMLWGGVSFLIRYAETGRKDLLFWIFASALVGTACHIVFTLNMAVTCLAFILYMIFFPYGRSWLRRGVTAMAVAAAAVALPLALRSAFTSHGFNLIHTHRQGMLIITDRFALVDPVEILARLGPSFFFALIVIPFFIWVADGGERRRLTWMLFLVPVLLVLNPLTGALFERTLGYLHYRILYAAPLFCYLGLALVGLFRMVVVGRSEDAGKRSVEHTPDRTRSRTGRGTGGTLLRIGSRLIAAGLLLLFLFFPLRHSLLATGRSVEGILGEGADDSGVGRVLAEQLDSVLTSRSVIASDPRTSYIVSAFTDHFVTITLDQHCSPVDTAAILRLRKTRDLFSPAVPLLESAEWLLAEGVDYLLVNVGYERATDFFATVPAGGGALAYGKFKRCEGILDEVLSFDGFHLFKLDREALASGEGLHCSDTVGGTLECNTVGEGKAHEVTAEGGVILERIVTERAEMAPGDTLRGHFCWSVDRELEFGLPYQWTIRLDCEFPKGPFYRYWYGKQYRRRIERDAGIFYRFTYSERLVSGNEQPDRWDPEKTVRQDYEIPVTEWLREGTCVMRVSVRRLSYLPNRTIGDYLLNEDSFHGVQFGSLRIGRDVVRSGDSGNVDE